MKTFKKSFLVLVSLFNTSYFLLAQQSTELYTMIEYPVLPAKYCDLEETMKETSGIIYSNGSIWTINDSGGEAEIYKIDKETGLVSQRVIILNGTNRDWEDITEDEHFMYVGDVGNNHGDRDDLKIYKIKKKDISGKKKVEVNAEIIGFSFNDQQSFEINSRNHNFDCESLASFGDSLILFSKNWVDGKSRMYKLPKVSGQYKIDPIDVFDADGLITGADYNSSLKKLALIGYKDHTTFIFLVNGFDGKTLAGKEIYRFNLFKMKDAQTEGIAWSTGETVLFSTEKTDSFAPQVFEFDIQKVFKIMGK
jgi:hypothetical protein